MEKQIARGSDVVVVEQSAGDDRHHERKEDRRDDKRDKKQDRREDRNS